MSSAHSPPLTTARTRSYSAVHACGVAGLSLESASVGVAV